MFSVNDTNMVRCPCLNKFDTDCASTRSIRNFYRCEDSGASTVAETN